MDCSYILLLHRAMFFYILTIILDKKKETDHTSLFTEHIAMINYLKYVRLLKMISWITIILMY
jgi:hypothetical protein